MEAQGGSHTIRWSAATGQAKKADETSQTHLFILPTSWHKWTPQQPYMYVPFVVRWTTPPKTVPSAQLHHPPKAVSATFHANGAKWSGLGRPTVIIASVKNTVTISLSAHLLVLESGKMCIPRGLQLSVHCATCCDQHPVQKCPPDTSWLWFSPATTPTRAYSDSTLRDTRSEYIENCISLARTNLGLLYYALPAMLYTRFMIWVGWVQSHIQ